MLKNEGFILLLHKLSSISLTTPFLFKNMRPRKVLLLVLAANLTVILLVSAYMFYGGYPLHSNSVANVTSSPGLSNESVIRPIKSQSLGSHAKNAPVSRSIASFVKCSF